MTLKSEVEDVDAMFMSLQDTYRSYEKELNAMKAELKETVNKLDMTREREYQDRVAEFKADYERYNSKMQEFRSQFNNWRTSEQERISQLKITLPTNLLGIFEEIRKQGDPSSK
jgi:predicted  nucleic acid-binding Zn-ribbon protein